MATYVAFLLATRQSYRAQIGSVTFLSAGGSTVCPKLTLVSLAVFVSERSNSHSTWRQADSPSPA